jgi:hypothetical protein
MRWTNTRTHKGLEWFGPPERNTLLHWVVWLRMSLSLSEVVVVPLYRMCHPFIIQGRHVTRESSSPNRGPSKCNGGQRSSRPPFRSFDQACRPPICRPVLATEAQSVPGMLTYVGVGHADVCRGQTYWRAWELMWWTCACYLSQQLLMMALPMRATQRHNRLSRYHATHCTRPTCGADVTPLVLRELKYWHVIMCIGITLFVVPIECIH